MKKFTKSAWIWVRTRLCVTSQGKLNTLCQLTQNDRIALALLIAGAVLIGAALFASSTEDLVFPDTIQHLSAAENLLESGDYATSVSVFPAHYSGGAPPVPQTVWPPGAALVAVAAHWLVSAEGHVSLLVLSCASVASLGVFLFLAMRRMAVPLAWAVALSLIAFALPSHWYFGAMRMTEAPFAALQSLTVLALVTACTSSGRSRPLAFFLAGMAAGGAILLRYQGLYMLPGVAVAIVLATRGDPARNRLSNAALTVIPPIAVTTGLLVRNWQLTGVLSGGQFQVLEPLGPLQATSVMTWSILSVVDDQLPLSMPNLAAVLLGVVVCAFVAQAIFLVAALIGRATGSAARTSSTAIAVPVVTIAVTLAVHWYSAATKASYFLDESRYFEVLVPLALLIVGACTGQLVNRWPRLRLCGIGAIILAVILAASNLHGRWGAWLVDGRAREMRLVKDLLNETSDSGHRLEDDLRREVSEGGAVLAGFAQPVFYYVRVPVVGPTSAVFTSTVWDENRLRTLSLNSGVVAILIFREDLEMRRSRNLPFLRDLWAGTQPGWVTPISTTSRAMLLRVEQHKASQRNRSSPKMYGVGVPAPRHSTAW